MKVGDLVRSPMTEQYGVIVRLGEPAFGCPGSMRVVWTTQGLSMFGPGSEEWCSQKSLELISEKM